ncbi:hypothetical protein HUE46_13145 [Flavobacterium columnare]|uniref:KTSC domain-containing protein n=2 Tax=Flavobacterium columnare TaxID=996 RepID=G8XA09_FLACA|nr:hypothetical protein [Flavobacterium columnare]AEW85173.1 hypothetical protein FCOL_01620 [Flavobacterium columnare ATCC 49512]AMO19546.1 hypothetical protein UN65_03585 [Flavobacterium columnare]ANO49051.1 hypothetical protein Pf1_00803 [Flavobacterium columnare]APT22945.1 hypothetical protein BU993_10160 [Flavobacterium columnare]MEB3800305.1 hypothetical protein [Flavobacterium columnare]
MERYRNLSGTSAVYSYQIGNDFIKIRFASGAIYTYSYNKAGAYHINQMKTLALKGLGLNSYINRNVKYKYD